jgi:hypothetical protein
VTLGPQSKSTPNFVQKQLNSADSLFRDVPSLSEAIKFALDEAISPQKDETWASLKVLPAVQLMISHAVLQLFVGKALARNVVFAQKVADFSYAVIVWSIILDWCPVLLRPLIVKLLPVKSKRREVEGFVRSELRRNIESILATDSGSSIDNATPVTQVSKPHHLLFESG